MGRHLQTGTQCCFQPHGRWGLSPHGNKEGAPPKDRKPETQICTSPSGKMAATNRDRKQCLKSIVFTRQRLTEGLGSGRRGQSSLPPGFVRKV